MKRRTITITLDERTTDETFDDALSQIGDIVEFLHDLGLKHTELQHSVIHETNLTWDDLSDLDKGAVLMFMHKVEYEGEDYALENYPVRFIEHPELLEMSQDEANDFALTFEDLLEEGVPGDDEAGTEFQRLYELALKHDRER